MENNITQSVEKKYDSIGNLNLYCMVCALSFAKLAQGKPESIIQTRIFEHINSLKHMRNVSNINNPKKNNK